MQQSPCSQNTIVPYNTSQICKKYFRNRWFQERLSPKFSSYEFQPSGYTTATKIYYHAYSHSKTYKRVTYVDSESTLINTRSAPCATGKLGTAWRSITRLHTWQSFRIAWCSRTHRWHNRQRGTYRHVPYFIYEILNDCAIDHIIRPTEPLKTSLEIHSESANRSLSIRCSHYVCV
jgi:hypothetical protein